MIKRMTYELKGTFCTYFETDYVRLDDFPTLESDWGRLLHHLTKADALLRYGDGEEDTLRSMLENHVLTVLCDIARKKLSNYGNSFANVQGTAMQAAYVQKLRQDINRWIARLDNYLYSTWQTGNNNSPAAETARWLKERLEQSLSADELDGNNNYYRMLRTVTAIQENVDYYLNQIKDSGDMNPALSLLIVYLKTMEALLRLSTAALLRCLNSIVRTFCMPYHRMRYKTASTSLSHLQKVSEVLPCLRMSHFPLAKIPQEKNLFIGLKKRIYQPHAVCGSGCTVRFSNPSYGGALELYKQTIQLQDTTDAQTLFVHGEELRIGWQVESPMLVLNEGERNISIYFHLTADSSIPNNTKGFVLQLSGAEGWMEQTSECYIESDRLCFSFSLPYNVVAPASCMEEVHGTTTEYPVIRILTDNANCPYKWAQQLIFDSVEIKTEVNGIRNFSFYNDQGEVDTT